VVARRGVRPFAFTNPIWLVHRVEAEATAAALPKAATADDAGNEVDGARESEPTGIDR
jgi:hypothetical protein